jgi:hypothetical protein
MGYIGLLLNAPYKIDRREDDEIDIDIFRFHHVRSVFLLLHWAIRSRARDRHKKP